MTNRAALRSQARNAEGIRVLIACEFSATVRDAFRVRGFDAWSCDLLPTEGDPAWHIQDDLSHVLTSWRWGMWDLIIAHPPCTDLAVSGARYFPAKRADGRQDAALDFVRMIMAANAPCIAIENPISIISSAIRKPDQIIQPWQFGHGEVKATCLWLKGLPKLIPTHLDGGDLFTDAAPTERDPRVWRMPPSADRWKERSRTLPGIAAAMADQWGDHLLRSTRDRSHNPITGAGDGRWNALHAPAVPHNFQARDNVRDQGSDLICSVRIHEDANR